MPSRWDTVQKEKLWKTCIYKHKSSVRLLFYFYRNFSLYVFIFIFLFFNKGRVRSTREGAVKSTASLDIHSRCWLDLVEPGPAVLGAGFSCLFLQVWCLMLIPPHVPWVLSKHAGAGDSAGRPALPPARASSLSASPGGPPTHTATASTSQCPSPYLSPELLPWMPVRRKPRNLLPLLFHFKLSPLLQTSVSFWVWTLLTRGYVHTAAPQALLQPWTGQLLL